MLLISCLTGYLRANNWQRAFAESGQANEFRSDAGHCAFGWTDIPEVMHCSCVCVSALHDHSP
jgi:hypothetical protein